MLGAALLGAQTQPSKPAVAAVPAKTAAQKAKPSYAEQPFVYEKIATQVTFDEDGNSTRQVIASVRIQSPAGVQQFSVLPFPYPSASADMRIVSVRVVQPDGTIIATPASDIQDMPAQLTQEAPYFSDIREKEVAVKGLAVGDLLEYEMQLRFRNRWVGKQLVFDYNFYTEGIALDEELEIRVPADRHVNIQSPRLHPKVTRQGSEMVYLWKTSHLKSAAQKASGRTASPSVLVTTFRDWAQVGRWYQSLERPQARPTPAIRAKAEALTKGMTGDEEKLRAIYDYVSLGIRYVGIGFGIGRLKPHSADEVLNNGFGDCKDKVTLLSALLAAVGIHAYPALINSAAKINAAAPSPNQFNHLIAVIPRGNSYLWLDTTVGVAPPGFLAVPLRGQQALVIPDSGPARLVQTPPNSPFPDSETFQADAKLNEKGTLSSKMKISSSGDLAVTLRLLFRTVPEPKWKDLVQLLSERLGFGGTVSKVSISPTESTDPSFQIQYDYQRKNYPDWGDGRITAPLPMPMLPQASSKPGKTPTPIHLGSPDQSRFIANVALPPGYTAELPSAVNRIEEFAGYQSTYSFADNMLRVNRRLTIKATKVPAADGAIYKAFVKAVRNDATSYIVFHAGGAVTSSTVPYQPNAAARKLYRQGWQEFQEEDFGDAADSFQKAVAADPKFALAQAGLGMCEVNLGNAGQGIADLKKAIQIDPRSVGSYKELAEAQLLARRPNAALQTWEELEKRVPNDSDAPARIGAILLSLGRYGAAVSPLETAVKRDPTNPRLLSHLGSAYLNSNSPDKAANAFEREIRLDPSDLNLNNAAYELAEKNAHLDLALRYAKQAVRKVEGESALISLDSLDYSNLKLMSAVVSYWDTLGWVDFRLGNLEGAQKYLDAAWVLSETPMVGYHLGRVYQKEGKDKAAARLYALALASLEMLGPIPPKDVQLLTNAGFAVTLPGTRERLAALLGSQARVDQAVQRAGGGLSSLRTVDLPKFTKKSGTADFFILFKTGPAVAGVKFLDGAPELRAAAKDLESSHFDVPFPDAGPERIVRRGVLDCEPVLSHCIVVLETPDSVHSLQ